MRSDAIAAAHLLVLLLAVKISSQDNITSKAPAPSSNETTSSSSSAPVNPTLGFSEGNTGPVVPTIKHQQSKKKDLAQIANETHTESTIVLEVAPLHSSIPSPMPVLVPENKTATVINIPVIADKNTTAPQNATTTSPETSLMSDMGAKKRGVIVFGSLTLFVFFYFVYKIYRRKKNVYDNDMGFELDNQQFKYGMLLSNNERDNLSNVPLTIDSDEEEDDELEIFDLEGRRRSLDRSSRLRDVGDEPRSRLLVGGEDVEILDLDLPGVQSASRPLNAANDEDLLNLDEEINEILSKSPSGKRNEDSKSFDDNDDFFKAL